MLRKPSVAGTHRRKYQQLVGDSFAKGLQPQIDPEPSPRLLSRRTPPTERACLRSMTVKICVDHSHAEYEPARRPLPYGWTGRRTVRYRLAPGSCPSRWTDLARRQLRVGRHLRVQLRRPERHRPAPAMAGPSTPRAPFGGGLERGERYDRATTARSCGSRAAPTGPGGSSLSRDTTRVQGPGGGSAAVHQTKTYNPRTGQNHAFDTARVGKNVYAKSDGKVYRNIGDGWHATGGETAWSDRESEARGLGDDRVSSFGKGGWGSSFGASDLAGGFGGGLGGGGFGGFRDRCGDGGSDGCFGGGGFGGFRDRR